MALDGWNTIKATVEGLTHRQLVTVGKALRAPAGLGFDPQKLSKEALANRVKQIAFQVAAAGHATEADFRASPPERKETLYSAVLGVLNAALGETAGPDVEAVETDSLFETDNTAADAIAAAEKALEEAKRQAAQGPKLNVDAVTKLIDSAVERKFAERVQSYRIVVRQADQSEVVTDEAQPRHEVFVTVLELCNAGLNVMLVGPAGSGKTHIAQQVAKALGRQFGVSGAIGSEYKLLGFNDAQGRYVETEYFRAYRDGWLWLQDEMDSGSANAYLALNSGWANGYQDFPCGRVDMHVDFRLIASANTYGHGADRQYVGRNQLDAATLDRFAVVDMGYDEKLERTLHGDTEWTSYCQKARRAVASCKIRHVVSMRAIGAGARLIEDGKLSRPQIEQAVLWKHLKGEDVAKIKSAMGV